MSFAARVWQHVRLDLMALAIVVVMIVLMRWIAPLVGADAATLIVGWVGFVAVKSHLRIEAAGLRS